MTGRERDVKPPRPTHDTFGVPYPADRIWPDGEEWEPPDTAAEDAEALAELEREIPDPPGDR